MHNITGTYQFFLRMKEDVWVKPQVQTLFNEERAKISGHINSKQLSRIEHLVVTRYFYEYMLKDVNSNIDQKLSENIFIKTVNKRLLVYCLENTCKDKIFIDYIDPIEEAMVYEDDYEGCMDKNVYVLHHKSNILGATTISFPWAVANVHNAFVNFRKYNAGRKIEFYDEFERCKEQINAMKLGYNTYAWVQQGEHRFQFLLIEVPELYFEGTYELSDGRFNYGYRLEGAFQFLITDYRRIA